MSVWVALAFAIEFVLKHLTGRSVLSRADDRGDAQASS